MTSAKCEFSHFTVFAQDLLNVAEATLLKLAKVCGRELVSACFTNSLDYVFNAGCYGPEQERFSDLWSNTSFVQDPPATLYKCAQTFRIRRWDGNLYSVEGDSLRFLANATSVSTAV